MKKTCAVIMFMFAVVTMCFALGTRRKLECSSEGYSWGYSHPSYSRTQGEPSYYSEEEKNAWKDGARRGQQDKKDKKDYDDPYMKQLQSSCVYD